MRLFCMLQRDVTRKTSAFLLYGANSMMICKVS